MSADEQLTSGSPYPPHKVIILCIVLSIITAVTIGGNLLVILAVGLVKKLRTPSNFLIVSLALSDLLVGLLVIPLTGYIDMVDPKHLTEALCDTYISFDVLMCTASILNLCAISIDRYLAITRPLQYAAKRTPQRMVLMIGSVWIASALISIPPMFGFKEEFVPGKCEYNNNVIYQIYATCGAFYIPLVVMIVLYGRIFILARRMAQEDAKQKRVTDSVAVHANQINRSSVYLSGEFQPVRGARQIDSIQAEQKPSSVVGKLKTSAIERRYPLPPSPLCRRQKPRMLSKQYNHRTVTEVKEETEKLVSSTQESVDISPQTPNLSHTEEFEERVKALRKLRAEFFAAPPSRHSSSVILNFRRTPDENSKETTFDLAKAIELLNCKENENDIKQTSKRSTLQQSQSMRATNETVMIPTLQARCSMPPPPVLSISDYADDPSIICRTSRVSEPLSTSTTAIKEKERTRRTDSLAIPFNGGNKNSTQLLRPKTRPLHVGRRSLASESSQRDSAGRCHSLAIPRNAALRRLSTPSDQLTWRGTSLQDSKQSIIERSTSRLFHRSSDQGATCPRSRTASWASIRMPVKRRKPRGHSETKAIKTLGVIMGCFCLCWIPFFIIQVSNFGFANHPFVYT
ncbi:7 transmembrane receptor [Paragonimus heterotremus]|uniref:7 transmembrane receptor n=1 Tax=Paragonimus heterotremus TaxID=100268 RepID=A0A8J4TDR3_9TREM|nr:7 transmembrane receptor [Paragonimus heterotremus]